jgi:hypothetical protein
VDDAGGQKLGSREVSGLIDSVQQTGTYPDAPVDTHCQTHVPCRFWEHWYCLVALAFEVTKGPAEVVALDVKAWW